MADHPHPFFAPQGGSMRSAAPTSDSSVDLVEPGRLCRELLARGSLDQRDDQGPTMTAEALLDGHYREHVSALFDRHAADFEPLLLGSLQYETPAQLERALLAFVASTGASDGVLSSTACLDLGCGTGLAGALLRKHCTGHLFGCDLSSSMIRIAESKGVYDAVPTCGDCVAYLRDQKASSADLIVAADVICYLHGLAELFSAAAAALASGGVFAFSTETCRLDEVRGGLPPQGPGWLERTSERVAHCVEYVHYLVAQVRVSRSRIT
jgi:predicted TPR repeat methyltransferase